jgi:glycogen operon protein
MATAFAGSADLFDAPLRAPTSSINMITTHDGFTLEDLVTYENKHNEANGEDNRDGTDDNRSWNCGVEGPCDDPGVVALRRRQASAMLATLLLSIGVPMLVAGDEMGRTQGGNNNAYCQDNQLSWLNWGVIDAERLELTKRLIALRRHHPALRRLRFFTDQRVGDLMWFTPAGDLVTEDEWNDPASRSVAICFDGRDESGHGPVDDGDLLVLINGELEPVSFILAPTLFGHFVAELASDGAQLEGAFSAGDQLSVGPRSLLVLRSAEIA